MSPEFNQDKEESPHEQLHRVHVYKAPELMRTPGLIQLEQEQAGRDAKQIEDIRKSLGLASATETEELTKDFPDSWSPKPYNAEKAVNAPTENLTNQVANNRLASDAGSLDRQDNVSGAENGNNFEQEEKFRRESNRFLELIANNQKIKGLIEKTRKVHFPDESDADFAKRQSLNDLDILSHMSNSMYDLVHQSTMSYQDVTEAIRVPDKEKYVENFREEISDRLVEAVSSSSKVRHITDQELIDGGQPDQTNFVWFKGNAPKPADAREIRFYINASPDGATKTAEYLSQLSDKLDTYGLRMQFKFRKDLGEYERTDTCVAYLYMPKTETPEQKTVSDQWLEAIKADMAKIPADSLRDESSFFTNNFGKGLSFAEDTREAGKKKGASYTSQIADSIAESAGEIADQYNSLSPEAIAQISALTTKKLEALNYFAA